MLRNKFIILLLFPFLAISLLACTDSKEEEHPAYSNPTVEPLTLSINKDPKNAVLYFERAEALNAIKMDSLAILDLKKAIELDPNNSNYKYSLGMLYMYIKEPQNAIPYFRETIKIDPEHISAQLYLATAFFDIKQKDSSAFYLKNILDNAENHPGILLLQSDIARDDNEFELAEKYLEKVTKLFPDFKKGWMELAQVKKENNKTEFIEIYKKAFALDTLNADPYFEIGKWHEDNKNLSEAIKAYEQCIFVDYGYTPAYMRLGKVYLSIDSLEKAYRHFNLASQTRINYGEAYYYQSISLEKLGKMDEAKAAIRQALVYDKNNQEFQKQWDKLFN
ncbi:MAG TPA: tetratricopeptide repeat protein [Chitinophagaceae bacterium]|nr:tetratricopeptide repeat protein [Chitinophagaceae bacterium]